MERSLAACAVLLAAILALKVIAQEDPCLLTPKQDIVIVLDSSTSIARADFKKQLVFVNQLIDQIEIGPEANQVGIISFSDNQRLEFHLNSNKDKETLKKRVLTIKQMGGGTNTHKPLEYVLKNMFLANRGDRAEMKNIVIVITDGNSYEPDLTASASSALRNVDVEMYALGIGSGVDKSELLTISGADNRTFLAKSFDELEQITTRFASSVLGSCMREDPPPPPVISGEPDGPVDPGFNIQLKCSSETTDEQVVLQWYKNNVMVQNTQYAVEDESVVSYLKFDAVLTDNEAVFECQLNHPALDNPLTAQTSIIVLLVPGPPMITYLPGTSVMDDELMTLTCTSQTEDVSNTQVVWIRSSETLEGESFSEEESVMNVLVFPASLSDNDAKYECHVRHPNLPEPLIDYADFQVSPLPGPPQITIDPRQPLPGTRVTLTCVSEGNHSQTRVQWYRNNRVADTSFYTSGNVVRNDMVVTVRASLEYECRVIHPALSDYMTAFYSVNVFTLPGPPTIEKGDLVITSPSQSFTLLCLSEKADEKTELVWVRGSNIIDRSFQRNGEVLGNEYTFRSISDLEDVTCQVQHPQLPQPLIAQPPTLNPIVLPGPPVINNGIPLEPVRRNTPVSLVCRSPGVNRDTAVVWYRSDQPNEPVDNTYYIQDGHVVNTLNAVAGDDSITYTCSVSHPNLGRDPYTAKTRIPLRGSLSPPKILGIPSIAIPADATIELTCLADVAYDTSQLTWSSRGAEIDVSYELMPNGRIVNSLTFNLTQLSDPELDCVLSDPSLDAQLIAEANLIIAPPTTTARVPVVPENLVLTGAPDDGNIEFGRSKRLVCTAYDPDRQGSIRWYIDGEVADVTYDHNGDGYVYNEFDYSPKTIGRRDLTCRLDHDSAPLSRTTFINTAGLCRSKPMLDILVIIDTSTSMSSDDYRRQVQFLELFISSFQIGSDAVQVGILSQSDSPLEFGLSEYSNNKNTLLNGLNTIQQSGQRSTMDVPLSFARLNVFTGSEEDRPGVDNLVIVLTTSNSYRPERTAQAARDLRDAGVEVYAIGVGNVDNEELVNIAGSQKGVFRATDFTALQIMDDQIINAARSNQICLDIPGPPRITGQPSQPMSSGARMTLTCSSAGRSPSARLVWYRDGREVDATYSVRGDFIVNEYNLTATSDLKLLECRLIYPPTNLIQGAPISFNIRESAPELFITQRPENPVRDGSNVNLACQAEHGDLFDTRNARLEWINTLDDSVIDSSAQMVGSFIRNQLTIRAVPANTQLMCRLFVDELGYNVQLPHKLELSPFEPPAPMISGVPSEPQKPGTPIPLTCTWTYDDFNGVTLEWVNPLTETVLDSTFDREPTQLVNRAVFNASSGVVQECRLNHPRLDEVLLVRGSIPVEEEIDCLTGSAAIDVVIILDSSTSITRSDFSRQLEFVKRFVSAFTIGPNDAQVGVISFSNDAEVNFQMNTYQNKESLTDAITNIKQLGGGTNTHLPIQRARTEMFTVANGYRPDVPNLCIVMTDGQSYEGDKTKEEARLMRAAGTDIYAIGVGSGVQFQELENIAGNQDRIFFADNYEALKNIENKFVQAAKFSAGACSKPGVWQPWGVWSSCSKTCGAGVRERRRVCDGDNCAGNAISTEECIESICPPTKGCQPISHEADIAFLLDTSSSVYEPDFETMKIFLADFIGLFNISQSQQRISSLTFADEIHVNFHLDEFNSNAEVKNAFLRIAMHLGGTKTDKALSFMRNELFSPENGARTNSPKIGFVITDGKSYDPSKTTAEASLTRQAGVHMYSIGIGPKIDRDELERIAGDASRVYHVDSYDDIVLLKQRMGVDLSQCYDPNAKVDGVYGPWSSYSICSVTCGVGTKSRSRRCDSPAPRNGGSDCQGPSVSTKRCKKPSCDRVAPPDRSGWTEWEYSSPCSTTCGEGTQEVTRYCNYASGCILGEVERKVISCKLRNCPGVLPSQPGCGGVNGVNVMLVSQGVNRNGPHAYQTVLMMKNVTQALPVDGRKVKTSLTLGDCSCSKNVGYGLTDYYRKSDILQHLKDLDLHDTASVLRQVRRENSIRPQVDSRSSDAPKQVVVLYLDSNDSVSQEAILEANKLKMAGVHVIVVALDNKMSTSEMARIASSPYNLMVVQDSNSADTLTEQLVETICLS